MLFNEEKNSLAIKYGFVDWNDMLKAVHNGTFDKSVQQLYEDILVNILNENQKFNEIQKQQYQNGFDAHLCIREVTNGIELNIAKGYRLLCSRCRYSSNLNFVINQEDYNSFNPITMKSDFESFINSLQHIVDSGVNEIRVQELIDNHIKINEK